MSRTSLLWAAALSLSVSATGSAQTAGSSEAIANQSTTTAASVAGGLPYENLEQLRVRAAALCVVSEKKKGTPEWRDAAIAEVKTLSRLAAAKDDGLNARRRVLLSELLTDENISRNIRCSLEAGSANADISVNESLSPDEKLEKFAEVAWQMASKYPERKQSYESLLRIARDSNDSDAVAIARRLLHSPASDDIKTLAREVVSRTSLVGKNVQELAGKGVSMPAGPLCLATWSAKTSGSITLVERLGVNLPDEITLVAVCLDSDVDNAKKVVQERALVCQLLYAGANAEGVLAENLQMRQVGQVYLTDAQGKILTTSGLNKLMADLWQKKHGKEEVK